MYRTLFIEKFTVFASNADRRGFLCLNSFHFLSLQINVCDDYSLPIDFVKKRPSSLEHCRDVRFADDFPSPNILNEQVSPSSFMFG